jgi:hypothetical protein
MSAASFADGELHFLQKMGIDDTTAGWIDLGLSVAGAGVSLGTNMAASAQAGTQMVDGVDQPASQVVDGVDRSATAISGVANVAHGASVIAAGQAQSDGDRALADEACALAQGSHLLRFMRIVIDDAQASDEDSKRIMNTIANAKGIQDKTAVTSATALRG